MKTKLFFLLPLFLILFGCSNDSVTPEKETLKSITYEVLIFEYIPDTGKNTSKFHYEIKYTNPNNVAVKGTSRITCNFDGLILTPIKRVPPYSSISQNSSYTEIYDVETALNPDLGMIKSITFVSAEFVIVD